MSARLFGTDGVRGVANRTLTPELCFSIGRAAAALLVEQGVRQRVVMGRDTRRSGPMLGAALASGFCSMGVDVVALGVVPTGCVSYIARTGDYGMGAVISASHNPAPDNGVKLIGHDGRKLGEAAEQRVEEFLGAPPAERPVGAEVGRLDSDRSEIDRYLAMLESLAPERLDGLSAVVDASNGAAFELGPAILRRLGVEVREIGTQPDGMNINEEGGATKPGVVQSATEGSDAWIGIAFDGDADRAVFSDDQGRLINGDRTMALWCNHWKESLQPPVVVGTVMSNGGFEAYMASVGIRLDRVQVGDKYVSAELDRIGGKIGGEQSGHIIFSERGPTGDGLITAIEVLRVLKRDGRKASAYFGDYESWPQVLVNVSVASRDAFSTSSEVQAAIGEASEWLAGRGRINVRASGTQPMVRVMVEADDYDLRDRATARVVEAFERHLQGRIYSRVDLTHALGD